MTEATQTIGDPGFLSRFDVLTVGNAIVDILARTAEDFLVRRHLAKGSMQLIDEAAAEAL